jgi:beta-glucosidase
MALSLAEQIGQLFVVRTSGFLRDEERRYPQWELSQAQLQQALAEYHIGGVLLYGGDAQATPRKIQGLQAQSALPLLVCADLEEGAGQHFRGTTRLPPAMALAQGGKDICYRAGYITAQESRALGVNWVLAPVADVNANPLNPVINVRAFGESPEVVSTLSVAFWQGLQDGGVWGCAKHFPGHGDTAQDSHLELPRISLTYPELEQDHWPPFRALIQAGVPAIMAAHVLVPSLDPIHPASLSFEIVTELLQRRWGFRGLVVTDALTMGAINLSPEVAAVQAVKAGADILLMPADLPRAYQGVLDAVRRGEISEARLYQSVQKILSLKANEPEVVLDWESWPTAAYRQCLRVKTAPLPDLSDFSTWQNLIVYPTSTPLDGPLKFLHPHSWLITPDQTDFGEWQRTEILLVHLLITTGPYQSFTELPAALKEFLREAKTQTRLIVCTYGNPYLLQELTIERIDAFSPQPAMQQAVIDLLRGI